MIEVKVICPCGTKFKFDTEPVDGRMAAPVTCPRCNENRTDLANLDIATKLAALAAAAPPHSPSHVAPRAPPAVTPVAPVAPKPGPVRVGAVPSGSKPVLPPAKPAAPAPPRPPAVPAAASRAPAPPAPGQPGLPVGNKAPVAKADPEGAPPLPRPVSPDAAPVAKVDDSGEGKATAASGSKKPSFALAGVGALLGALLGMAIWVAVIIFTGIRSGYVALLVGVTAGFGAKLLGRGTSTGFGVVAALCALLGIVGGSAVALTADFAAAVTGAVESAYEARVELAKNVAKAKNDDELRKAAVRELAADRTDPKTISDADLQKFKSEEVPRLKALAEGKSLKSEVEAQLAAEIVSGFDYGEVIKRFFSIFAIISWIIALGAAFRIASG